MARSALPVLGESHISYWRLKDPMNFTLPQQIYASDVLASLALLLFLLAVRLLAGRALRARDNLTPHVARRWTANLRNLLLVVAVLGLIFIWAPQLRTFALSLTAVAVALVVATKELILCLSGSALRTFTRAYSVGDYVEIGGLRGEVVDYDLLVTRLHEFENRGGSFIGTGRQVLVPHSLLFTAPSRIEGEAGGLVRHEFQLTFEPDVNLFAQREAIENVAREAQRSHEPVSEGWNRPPKRKTRSEPAQPEVEIGFGTSDIGKYRLDIAVLVRPEHAGAVENAVACAIADLVHRLRAAEEGRPSDSASDTGSAG